MNFNKNFLAWVSGHFEWDDRRVQGLIFTGFEDYLSRESKSAKKKAIAQEEITTYGITFREEIDVTEKLRFRKYFLRRCRIPEAEIITLQDVKDVVLFTTEVKTLTGQFIDFLHIPTVDNLLRALIVYFQYFFMVHSILMEQRSLLKKKIKHPDMIAKECIIRDDLADLRSMVSREFCSLLVGSRDSKQFHHMKENGVSLSDKDRRLIEMLIKFSTRVVWYALHKPVLEIIERETDRLIRSEYFNKYAHQHVSRKPLYDYEKLILHGTANRKQPRLISKSPLGNEVIFVDHDYRMLAVGQADFPPNDLRKTFMERVYTLPEEYFTEKGICIGILGMRRADFDIMLKRKRKKTKKEDEAKPVDDEIHFHFEIPPRLSHSTKNAIRSSFSVSKQIYLPYFNRQANREYQRNIWKNWVTCVNRSRYDDPTSYSLSHISTTALFI